jgi:phage terminase Nu1 subunit (DNA packaging protein)
MSKSPKLTADAATAARVLGVTRRQFDRLVKAGTLPAAVERQFDLEAVVPAFVRYVEQGRTGATTIAEAKLATEREKARKLALENAVKSGQLIYSDQVAEVLSELSADLARHLEAVPGRHADELAALTERAAVRLRLLEIVRDARASFAAGIETIADRLAKA